MWGRDWKHLRLVGRVCMYVGKGLSGSFLVLVAGVVHGRSTES